MKLNFSEIRDWKEFEDLAAAYFRSVVATDENQVIEVFVQPWERAVMAEGIF